jgi:hypothetical protein
LKALSIELQLFYLAPPAGVLTFGENFAGREKGERIDVSLASTPPAGFIHHVAARSMAAQFRRHSGLYDHSIGRRGFEDQSVGRQIVPQCVRQSLA